MCRLVILKVKIKCRGTEWHLWLCETRAVSGFKRHESVPHWPLPRRCCHLSEEAVWRRPPSSYRRFLLPYSKTATRSQWSWRCCRSPSRQLEVWWRWKRAWRDRKYHRWWPHCPVAIHYLWEAEEESLGFEQTTCLKTKVSLERFEP